MYMRLLYYANLARYKQSGGDWVFRRWVEVQSKDIITDLGVHRTTMYRIRDELVSAGYIRFKAGIGSGKTEYNLCLLFDGRPDRDQNPSDKPSPKKAHEGSFDTAEFWDTAVAHAYREIGITPPEDDP